MTKKSTRRSQPKKTNKMNILKGVGKYSKAGPRRLKGRGGYAEDIGGAIGNWLGKKAGGLFSSITGLGSYSVNKNSLLSAQASDPPTVSNTSGGTRVQHREYIQDIAGSIVFNIQSFPVNPGLPGTFPWLASVANAFEEYRLHGILFEFKSTSADALNSTNTALGTVIMATEYNPLHGNFTAKRDMENYVYSTSSAPSISALHPLECARDVSVLDELFVRNVPLVGADLRFSDLGNFQIATVGMQAIAVIGELWVTYDIELLKPKLPDAFSSVGPAHYVFNTGTPLKPVPAGTTPANTTLFGANGGALALLGTGVSPVSLNVNTITFNQIGRYLFIMNVKSSASVITTPVQTYGTNVTAANILYNSLIVFNDLLVPVAGTNSGVTTFMFSCDVANITNQNTLVLSNCNFGTISEFELFVIPLPGGFSTPQLSVTDKLYDVIAGLERKFQKLSEKVIDLDFDEKHCSSEPPAIIRSEPDLSDSTSDLVTLLRNKFNRTA